MTEPMNRPEASRPARRRLSHHAALIALNGVLVAALAAVSLSPGAEGQSRRSSGEFAVMSMDVQGGVEDVLVIADVLNGRLGFARWEQGQRRLAVLDGRELEADLERAERAGGRRR